MHHVGLRFDWGLRTGKVCRFSTSRVSSVEPETEVTKEDKGSQGCHPPPWGAWEGKPRLVLNGVK